MFNPSRDQARQFLFDAWRKYHQREILSAMEDIALQIMLLHPEYHSMLNDPERYLHKDYLPEAGDTNPFLHMSMHMAVQEQLSINQPTGICAKFESLLAHTEDEHTAVHHVMECLGEMIWYAQRNQSAPDEKIYLDCLGRRKDCRRKD